MNIRLLLLLCVVLSPVPAWADWIEVESTNFVFVGETDEEDAREIVTDLETYRRAILALAGIRGAPEIRKVHVYGVRAVRDVRELTGIRGIAGAYALGDDSPVFVGISGWTDNEVRRIMLHEYAHHLLRTYTTAYFPRWYDEGFAEYLGSLEVEDGLVSVGIPDSQFGISLNRLRWTDVDFVLNSITAYPYERDDDSWSAEYKSRMFYGISWLAVHYIQSTPELSERFSDYISQLNRGVDPTEAFEAGFGLTQEDFGDRLRSYWRDNHFAVLQFRIDDAVEPPPLTVREIPEAEAEIALVVPRALFVSPDRDKASERAEVRADIQRLVKEYGPSPVLYSALSGVELRDGNYDGAVAIGEKAVALAPDDRLAVQTLADGLYHRSFKDEAEESDLVRARELFSKVLDLDPTNPTANNHYPVTFIRDGTTPDKKAIEAVAFNIRYKRNASYFDSYLDNVEVLSMAGRLDDACVLLSRVDHWIRVSSEKLIEKQTETRGSDDLPLARGDETRLERLTRLEKNFNGGCSASAF